MLFQKRFGSTFVIFHSYRQYIYQIWIAPNCKIKVKKIKCTTYKFAAIRIGFHEVPIMEPKSKTVVNGYGSIIFKGTAHIGKGTKIHVQDGATLTLGDNFSISASSQINCYKSISFGRDIQFSWDCLVMDSDTHNIYDERGKRVMMTEKLFLAIKFGLVAAVQY